RLESEQAQRLLDASASVVAEPMMQPEQIARLTSGIQWNLQLHRRDIKDRVLHLSDIADFLHVRGWGPKIPNHRAECGFVLRRQVCGDVVNDRNDDRQERDQR